MALSPRAKEAAKIYYLFCCSVAKLCLILCNPMDCSTPGFPVCPSLYWVCSNSYPVGLVMPSNSLILCYPLLLPSVFPSIMVFSMSQFFASGGQRIGASASTSVLPMNEYSVISFRIDWFDFLAVQVISVIIIIVRSCRGVHIRFHEISHYNDDHTDYIHCYEFRAYT